MILGVYPEEVFPGRVQLLLYKLGKCVRLRNLSKEKVKVKIRHAAYGAA
jgi:hypothetical protein